MSIRDMLTGIHNPDLYAEGGFVNDWDDDDPELAAAVNEEPAIVDADEEPFNANIADLPDAPVEEPLEEYSDPAGAGPASTAEVEAAIESQQVPTIDELASAPLTEQKDVPGGIAEEDLAFLERYLAGQEAPPASTVSTPPERPKEEEPPAPAPAPVPPPTGKFPPWMLTSLFGKIGESGGRDLGGLSKGIGATLAAGAKAVGNIGAAMNTAGAQQQAAYGNAPGAAVAAVTQGLGDTGAVGLSALGDMVGNSAEDFFEQIGSSVRDFAAHRELQAVQEEMYGELQRQIDWARKAGVPLDRAGIYEAWKNIENSAGNVIGTLNRERMMKQRGIGR
jgi:hypothetical protein